MTDEIMGKLRNGWGRLIATVLLSFVAAWGGASFALGQYSERIDTNRAMIEDVREHGSTQVVSLRERMARLEAKHESLEKILNRIETKIDQIHQSRRVP